MRDKLTDNEIIKALECLCQYEQGDCFKCPIYKSIGVDCMPDILEPALSLINRQKAEIERLTAENTELRDKAERGVDAYLRKQAQCTELRQQTATIVHCKDCKYSKTTTGPIAGEKIRVCMYPCIPCGVNDTHYCGYGERKDVTND